MPDNIIEGQKLFSSTPFNVINPSGISGEASLRTITEVGEGNRNRAVERARIASQERIANKNLEAQQQETASREGLAREQMRFQAGQSEEDRTLTRLEIERRDRLERDRLDREDRERRDTLFRNDITESIGASINRERNRLDELEKEHQAALQAEDAERERAIQQAKDEARARISQLTMKLTGIEALHAARSSGSDPTKFLEVFKGLVERGDGYEKLSTSLRDTLSSLIKNGASPEEIGVAVSRFLAPASTGKTPADVGKTFGSLLRNLIPTTDTSSVLNGMATSPNTGGVYRAIADETARRVRTMIDSVLPPEMNKVEQVRSGVNVAAELYRSLREMGVDPSSVDLALTTIRSLSEGASLQYAGEAKKTLAEAAASGKPVPSKVPLSDRAALLEGLSRGISLLGGVRDPDGSPTVKNLGDQSFSKGNPLLPMALDIFTEVNGAKDWDQLMDWLSTGPVGDESDAFAPGDHVRVADRLAALPPEAKETIRRWYSDQKSRIDAVARDHEITDRAETPVSVKKSIEDETSRSEGVQTRLGQESISRKKQQTESYLSKRRSVSSDEERVRALLTAKRGQAPSTRSASQEEVAPVAISNKDRVWQKVRSLVEAGRLVEARALAKSAGIYLNVGAER